MNRDKHIAMLIRAEDIVYAIGYYQGRIGYYESLYPKQTHKIEIYEMCIKRLKQRYNKVLTELQKDL